MKDLYNVLFLCTANSARSIMAEAITNQIGRNRFRAFSAGSQPAHRVHPVALELLSGVGLPTNSLQPKSWDLFAGPDAPQMDFIITLCDRAIGEPCPSWPGRPITAHWSVPDPSLVSGTPEQEHKAFQLAMQVLQSRIGLLQALRLEALDRLATETRLAQIGESSSDAAA